MAFRRILCAQPLHTPSATALPCSSSLLRAGPDAASHPPLCSQPENGYMCKWQDKKGKFIFKKHSYLEFGVEEDSILFLCVLFSYRTDTPLISYSDLKNLVFQALRQ